MDPASQESQSRSAPKDELEQELELELEQEHKRQPDYHHPVPSGLVHLYGLFAVLFVLLPEWMADLRQMSRNVRIQAHEVDRNRLTITLRRRLEARRRRALKVGAPLAHPANPDLSQSNTMGRSAQQPMAVRQWPRSLGLAALLVGVGSGLVWGGNQLKDFAWLSPSRQSSPLPVEAVPMGQLRLQSAEPSWVEVRNLEGVSLYAAILQGQVQLPLGRGVRVLAGRPDLVLVSWGGQASKPLGTIDRIEWVEFPGP